MGAYALSHNPNVPSHLLWHLLYGKPRRELGIDVESFSEAELNKVGAYAYWDHPSTHIQLLSYAFDDEPVQQYDLTKGEEPPKEFFDALTDPSVLKRAFNANFERLAFNAHYGIYCDPVQWVCVMVLGLSLGLPGSLGAQAKVMGGEHQKGDGKKAMMYFCKPCRPTKKNGQRTRNLPRHNPLLWHEYKDYNLKDVEAERALWKRLSKYNMQPRQWRAWALDQRINDRGVRVDIELIDSAIAINDIVKADLTKKIMDLTGLENPNSVKQLLKWLNDAESDDDRLQQKLASDDMAIDEIENTKRYYSNLQKKTVIELLGDRALDSTIRRVLELRQMLAKSSVSKYHAMKRSVCRDGRVRGLLQFYGAPRTGRWAGRIVQVQNLPKNYMKDLALIRQFVKQRRLKLLQFYFGENILPVLSELIRTAFIPDEGKRFVIVDFKAIEARLAAWDAQEQWRLEVFRTHGLIYEASASEMFGVPLEDCTKRGKRKDLRPKGKISELALGYQGAQNALVTMGALEEGMQEDELLPIVKAWRKASPRVTRDWYRTNDDAIECIETGETIQLGEVLRDKEGEIERRYGFEFYGNCLWQVLPSGRKLCYPNARIEWSDKFERDQIVFDGINQYSHQWGDIRTYGGKLFENRTQGNGVDNLTNAMFNVEDEVPGDIVFTVHDEIVIEIDDDWMPEQVEPDKSEGVKFVEAILAREQEGYEGLPLQADGMDAAFYQKGD